MGNGGHLSDDALERLELGLLGPDRVRELRQHLGACAACRTRAAALAAERRDLGGRTDPGVFERRAPAPTERDARPKRLGLLLGVLLIPAVVAAAVLALRPEPAGVPVASTGRARLEVYRGPPGEPLAPGGRLEEGAAVAAGEPLRFAYSSPRGGYLRVVGLSEKGELEAYYPPEGAEPVRAEAGSGVVVGGGAALAGEPGRVRLFLVITDEPLRLNDLRDAVRAARLDSKATSLPVLAEQASLLLVLAAK